MSAWLQCGVFPTIGSTPSFKISLGDDNNLKTIVTTTPAVTTLPYRQTAGYGQVDVGISFS